MKIRIELEPELPENEIVIRCRELTEDVREIQKAVMAVSKQVQPLVLGKEDAEVFVRPEEILFFETDGNEVIAHTREQSYQTKYRLYELEERLPDYFMRVAKSTIANAREIRAIRKNNLSTTSVAEFAGTPKQIYVSRHYSKALKEKIMEVRIRG
ncbi:MAG: LytTR family transcriptional regulator [Eubacterium sp.]|nr:LytTR family transcriptional regulator [Eubacterium sp.]